MEEGDKFRGPGTNFESLIKFSFPEIITFPTFLSRGGVKIYHVTLKRGVVISGHISQFFAIFLELLWEI